MTAGMILDLSTITRGKHTNMNFVGDNTNKGVGDNTNKGVRIQENVESTLAMGPWRLES